MPNLITELKIEIVRLSRKEIKKELAPVKKAFVAQRSLIAGLRRQIDAMQKELNGLKKSVSAPVTSIQATDAPKGRFWITGKGVKTLRKRLGLTQALFANLADVSMPTVVNWEGSKGKVEIRRKVTVAQLQAIRGMGKRQAAEMLGQGKTKEAKEAPPADKA